MSRQLDAWVAYGARVYDMPWVAAGYKHIDPWLGDLHAEVYAILTDCDELVVCVALATTDGAQPATCDLDLTTLAGEHDYLHRAWRAFTDRAWPNGDGPAGGWLFGATFR